MSAPNRERALLSFRALAGLVSKLLTGKAPTADDDDPVKKVMAALPEFAPGGKVVKPWDALLEEAGEF